MSEKKNVPKLRFPEFTEPWEQRKLGDCVEFLDTMRKPLKEGDREKGQYPYYGASGIVDYVSDYIFDEELVLLSEDGANITDRNYPVCFLASGKYWVNNHAHVLKTNKENENNFICNSLERMDFTPYNSGMAMPKLNKEVCQKIPLSCPSFAEQKEIGDYFRSLDRLITLHQRKYEKLKNIKKSMLEKMFPKNGSNVPEIRFKGFTDAWEQRKFGDIVQTRRGLTYKPTDIEESGIRVLRSSNIDEDTFVYGVDDVFVNPYAVNIEPVRKNDILITSANGSSRLVGKHALIKKISDGSAVHGGFMLLGRTKNYDFVNASMSSSWYTKFINVFAAGGNGAIGNLNKNDLDEQVILIPDDAEQIKIGEYFAALDNLITLHHRKLKKLEQIKQAMLHKMFV